MFTEGRKVKSFCLDWFDLSSDTLATHSHSDVKHNCRNDHPHDKVTVLSVAGSRPRPGG